MQSNSTILVLGANGLAGRAIVQRILRKTDYRVIAAGRRGDAVRKATRPFANEQLECRVLDALNADALLKAATDAACVINAIGPYARYGAAIARMAIQSRRPYIDCANEQNHYHRLEALDSIAREQGVALITAAGAIPGLSTLSCLALLRRHPDITHLDQYWTQRRHAYADSGLGSIMGAIVEAAEGVQALRGGGLRRFKPGFATRVLEDADVSGVLRHVEFPTIDTLTLARLTNLDALREAFYLGDLPPWLLAVLRWFRPDKSAVTFGILERIVRALNRKEIDAAIQADVSPEALLTLVAHHTGGATRRYTWRFRDGACATACLPATLAERVLRNEIRQTGLLTPADLIDPDDSEAIAGDALMGVVENVE